MPQANSQRRSKTNNTADAAGGAGPGSPPPESGCPYGAFLESVPGALALLRFVREEHGNPYDLEFSAANEAFRRLFDLSNLAGSRLGELDSNYRERDPDLFEICLRVSESHAPEEHTVYLPRLDRLFELRVSSVPDDLLLAAVTDITERKKAAESLLLTQLSVDAAADMVHWADVGGRLVYVNQSLVNCLGYSRDDLLSLHLWDIVHGLSRELFFSRVEQAHGGDSFSRVGALRAKDGRSVPVEVSSTWVELNDTLVVVSTLRDITERTAMLQTLLERDGQLRQSQKMEAVGRLAGGIAHDFNNALTTIVGYSDLLLSSPDCPRGSISEDIGEIKAAAERAGALTKRILAFSRRQTLQPAVMSLNTIVSDTERLLARTLGADVELRTSLSPELGQVEIDEHQFVQVLLNLAFNARDAMPKGGTLTLETANVDADERFCETHPEAHPGPYAVLTVTDTGTGMDSDVLAHVFEPFYTTKPPGQGTGLGLATVYGVVAQSGGCTYVQSELGRGTSFTIYLPRVDAVPQPLETDLSIPATQARAQTVMVVDSDAAFLALATRILKRRGYEVLALRDGEQAAATLADRSVRLDAILTDLRLSGTLQGEKLAGLAATKRPNVPVLFMSDQAGDTMVEAERVHQQVVCLEKPFTAEELARQVRTCLTRS